MVLIDGLTKEDYLDQLIEECGELVQAASKLKRARGTRNKTPVKEAEALTKLIEEIADVTLCIEMVERAEAIDMVSVMDKMNAKYARWKERTN